MEHKLRNTIGIMAGLTMLYGCNVKEQKQHKAILPPPAANVTVQAAASAPVSIPNFNEAEYRNMTIKPAGELNGSNEISNTAKTALYKIHANNKAIDALPSSNYDKAFLHNVIAAAGKSADEIFAARAEALGAAAYNLAYTHGNFNENKLLDIKFDVMPKISAVMMAERIKFGKETDDTQEMLYRVSFMGLKQIKEIIDLLKQTLPNSFPADKRQYGAQIADLIANVSTYHGWLAGLKKMGITPQIPSSFYRDLESDLINDRNKRHLHTINGVIAESASLSQF